MTTQPTKTTEYMQEELLIRLRFSHATGTYYLTTDTKPNRVGDESSELDLASGGVARDFADKVEELIKSEARKFIEQAGGRRGRDGGRGLNVEFNDISYSDSIEIAIYFECGETSPTPSNPGTYTGGNEGLLGPATYSTPINLMDGRNHDPFANCSHGWYSVQFIVDGVSSWFFFEWDEDY